MEERTEEAGLERACRFFRRDTECRSANRRLRTSQTTVPLHPFLPQVAARGWEWASGLLLEASHDWALRVLTYIRGRWGEEAVRVAPLSLREWSSPSFLCSLLLSRRAPEGHLAVLRSRCCFGQEPLPLPAYRPLPAPASLSRFLR